MTDPVPPNPAAVEVEALRFSATLAALAGALSTAQGQMQNPAKDKFAEVKLKVGGSYKFAYADLASVFDAIRQPLAQNGLAIVQAPSIVYHPEYPPVVAVTTRLLHSSGEWMENTVKMVADESRPQVVASAITYAKRYALQAMLAIVAEEDDDGNAASGNRAEVSQRHQQPAPARQPAPSAAPAPAPLSRSNQAIANEIADAKAQHDKVLASLVAKMGKDEADIQISAIKKKHGDDWRKQLAGMKALDESTPKPRE